MATRFWSADSGGGELVPSRACTSSSLVTGFALRTSGSAGAVELAAKALRVSGGPGVGAGDATGALVAAAPMFGAAAGLDPPVATAGVAVRGLRARAPFPGREPLHIEKKFH